MTLLFSIAAAGAEFSKDNIFITTVSKAGERPSNPAWANTIFLQLSDTSWLPGVCTSSDGVRVPEEDLAMLSIALKAIETGKKVFVRIETNRIIGGYCEAVQLSLRAN